MCAVEQMCVYILQSGQYSEVCVITSALCKYDLSEDNYLFLVGPG